jgi:hypothetical protein
MKRASRQYAVKRTNMLRVLTVLWRIGPLRKRDLVGHMRWSGNAIRAALRRLRDAGFVLRDGWGVAAVWIAVHPPEQLPELWGHHPRSLANLNRPRTKPKVRHLTKRHSKPRPGCALEQALGWGCERAESANH